MSYEYNLVKTKFLKNALQVTNRAKSSTLLARTSFFYFENV